MAYKEYPILFSGEMVRAVLEGHKTQTRRIGRMPILHYWPDTQTMLVKRNKFWEEAILKYPEEYAPYGIPGDRLWLRETFVLEDTDEVPTNGRPYCETEEPGEFGSYLVPHYRATEPEPHIVPLDLSDSYDDRTRWCPSIHMPRWASRITLEVTDVRVERVSDISLAGVHAEGKPENIWPTELEFTWFRQLWNSIYAKRGLGWDANPWVWVVEFRHTKEAT